jgi:hypothetical protein
VLAVLVTAGLGWAQEAPPSVWEPIVQVRQRLTLTDDPVTDVEGEIGQRALLGLEVHRTIVSARVSFQEVRRWTAARSGVVPPGGFAPTIAEGWAHVEGSLTRNIGAELTVGRQAIRIHEGRILGDDDFSLDGQFFDAVRVEGRAAPFSVEYINARRFLGADEDPLGLGVNVLRGGASGENPVTSWVADGLWVVDARHTSATTSTIGAYARLDTGRWRGRAEGYVQTSAAGTGTLIGLDAGWVFGPDERLTVRVRYDGISGDPSAGAGGRTAWQPVLGDSHTFNGLMDRFATPADSDQRGLADAQVEIEAHPAPQLLADVTAHRFWSPLDGGAFGGEIDASGRWSFSPFASAGLGGAWFVPDPSFDGSSRLYGYMEIDVAF